MAKRKLTGPVIAISDQNLRDHLWDSLRTLNADCLSYDEGAHYRHKSIANTLRMLLNRTGMQKPLLGTVGVRDSMRVFDSAGAKRLGDTHSVMNLVGLNVTEVPELSLSFIPKFGEFAAAKVGPVTPDRPGGFYVPFALWWETPLFADAQGNTFTRRRLVEEVANKAGGAHVDLELPADFYELTYGTTTAVQVHRSESDGSYSLTLGGEPPQTLDPGALPTAGSLVHAAIRQIAWELMRTLKARYSNFLPEELRTGVGGDG